MTQHVKAVKQNPQKNLKVQKSWLVSCVRSKAVYISSLPLASLPLPTPPPSVRSSTVYMELPYQIKRTDRPQGASEEELRKLFLKYLESRNFLLCPVH